MRTAYAARRWRRHAYALRVDLTRGAAMRRAYAAMMPSPRRDDVMPRASALMMRREAPRVAPRCRARRADGGILRFAMLTPARSA